MPPDEIIDPGIRNLIRIINTYEHFETCFSCEGHIRNDNYVYSDWAYVAMGLIHPTKQDIDFLRSLEKQYLTDDIVRASIQISFHGPTLSLNANPVITTRRNGVPIPYDRLRSSLDLVNREFVHVLENDFKTYIGNQR